MDKCMKWKTFINRYSREYDLNPKINIIHKPWTFLFAYKQHKLFRKKKLMVGKAFYNKDTRYKDKHI